MTSRSSKDPPSRRSEKKRTNEEEEDPRVENEAHDLEDSDLAADGHGLLLEVVREPAVPSEGAACCRAASG